MQNATLYKTLQEQDPEVYKIIEDETWRQFSGLELIASEVRPVSSLSPSSM
jgi:glycine hydroxymethyltransferase